MDNAHRAGTKRDVNANRPASRKEAVFIHSFLDSMELRPIAFRVYAHLSRRADKQGRAFPGFRSIAKVCRIDRSSIGKALIELRERRMLTVEVGPRNGNIYHLTEPSEWLEKPATRSEKEDVTDVTEWDEKPATTGWKINNGTGGKSSTQGNPNSEGNPKKEIQKTRHTTSSGVCSFEDDEEDEEEKESLSSFSQQHLEVIHTYNRVCGGAGLRFLPVNRYTADLEGRIERSLFLCSTEEIERFCYWAVWEVRRGDRTLWISKTLFRVLQNAEEFGPTEEELDAACRERPSDNDGFDRSYATVASGSDDTEEDEIPF